MKRSEMLLLIAKAYAKQNSNAEAYENYLAYAWVCLNACEEAGMLPPFTKPNEVKEIYADENGQIKLEDFFQFYKWDKEDEASRSN